MSAENLDLVRRFYAEPDPLSALAGRIAADAEADFTASYPDRPVLSGVDEIRRFRAEGTWDELRFEPERFLDVGVQRVLVFVRVSATGAKSDVRVDSSQVAHAFTIRDGLRVRFKVYGDRTQALEAAGLEQ